MKVACLFSGGHIHTFDLGSQSNLLADLTVALEEEEKTFTVWDETKEAQLGVINLKQLQMAWIVD